MNVIGQWIIVKMVLVCNLVKYEVVVDLVILMIDFVEILNDEEIDIVVELLGGLYLVEEYIIVFLKQYKYVVIVNKDLIVVVGFCLVQLVYDNYCDLMYEVSVVGGILILCMIVNSFLVDQILEVKGIVNGMINYIFI